MDYAIIAQACAILDSLYNMKRKGKNSAEYSEEQMAAIDAIEANTLRFLSSVTGDTGSVLYKGIEYKIPDAPAVSLPYKDGYVRQLEEENSALRERIRIVEESVKEFVGSMKGSVDINQKDVSNEPDEERASISDGFSSINKSGASGAWTTADDLTEIDGVDDLSNSAAEKDTDPKPEFDKEISEEELFPESYAVNFEDFLMTTGYIKLNKGDMSKSYPIAILPLTTGTVPEFSVWCKVEDKDIVAYSSDGIARLFTDECGIEFSVKLHDGIMESTITADSDDVELKTTLHEFQGKSHIVIYDEGTSVHAIPMSRHNDEKSGNANIMYIIRTKDAVYNGTTFDSDDKKISFDSNGKGYNFFCRWKDNTLYAKVEER